jgi:hypothetical protein
MVFGYTPSGFEDYLRVICVMQGEPFKELKSEDWQQINNKFGVVYRKNWPIECYIIIPQMICK